MKKITLLFTLQCFVFLSLQAQKIDSIMSLYGGKFQQEKIHLHFDKTVYSPGETIWFKAYIMAGSELSDYSKSFYVDWFDQQGNLVTHTTMPVLESSARGQFEIPEKYAGKLLHAKAYTNWMLNFDTAFLFNKDIRVSQPITSAKQPQEKPQVASIQFFPEGGDLISGFTTRVAFLANNQYGLPVTVRGAIKNSKNELVDSFISEHDGMGSFTVDADAKEKYTATWIDQYGISHTTPLADVKPVGATLQVQPNADKIVFIIKRNDAATPNLKSLNCIAHMNQFLVYKSRINLASKLSGVGQIPIRDFPTGILQITLFDNDWVPVAERIVFINNQQHEFNPEVRVIKGNTKRAKTIVEVSVYDSILSNMSLSVTDGDLLNDNSNTIISQLLLAGDIKGYIHNPAYYFSSQADSVSQHLDLVMLTHGWRRYNWPLVLKDQTPVLKYSKDTGYLQIRGDVYGLGKNGIKPDQSINLIIGAKDTTRKSANQFLSLPVSRTGTFVADGVFFYDTIIVRYMFNGDKRLTDRAEVRFQSGLTPPPTKLFSTIASSPLFLSLRSKDSIALEKSRFFYNEKIKLDKLLAANMLDEVTVRTRAKSAKDILDEKYTSGLFSGGDANQFDVMNDPFAQGALDVFSYLQGRVAGLQINNNGGGTTLSWRGSTPSLFIDEIAATDAEQLRNISMSDVAYIKVFRPPFFGASGGGAGGAIAVYTRKGGDQKYTPGQGLGYSLLAGYTKYKEFYSPNYNNGSPAQADVRTTLYWSPYVLTDKKNKTVHIEFFNNDVSKKLRFVLEGVNADGKVARVEKMVE